MSVWIDRMLNGSQDGDRINRHQSSLYTWNIQVTAHSPSRLKCNRESLLHNRWFWCFTHLKSENQNEKRVYLQRDATMFYMCWFSARSDWLRLDMSVSVILQPGSSWPNRSCKSQRRGVKWRYCTLSKGPSMQESETRIFGVRAGLSNHITMDSCHLGFWLEGPSHQNHYKMPQKHMLWPVNSQCYEIIMQPTCFWGIFIVRTTLQTLLCRSLCCSAQ